MAKSCIMCGGALRPLPWWRKVLDLGVRMPSHTSWPTATEEEKDRCWRSLCVTLGVPLDKIGPRPRT